MSEFGFTFNKVYVLESLGSTETQTGQELFDDLLRWKELTVKDLHVNHTKIDDRTDFDQQFDVIYQECASGFHPIIHLEIHGAKNKTGLVLNSGELVEWNEIYAHLLRVNSKIGNNLFLTLAVCYGAYLLQTMKTTKPSPFWGFIGSFDTISVSDLSIRYQEFYTEFLESLDLTKAIKRLHDSNPNIPSTYRFINSEDSFKKIYEDYAENQFSDDAIKIRFEEEMKRDEYKSWNRSERRKWFPKFKNRLFKTRVKYLEEHKSTFFMYDMFPENKARFNPEINF